VRSLNATIVAGAAMLFAALSADSLATDHSAMMRLTIDGMIASQTNEGLFPYGFDFLADKPLEPDHMSASNLIRQAGSVSVLAAYYRHTHDARLRDPIRRALTALGSHSLSIGKSRAQYWIERTHVLSLPVFRWKLRSALGRFDLLYEKAGAGKVLSPSGDYGQALTGTGALALLAELHYASAEGDDRFAELRSALLEGLLMLRIPGAGFRASPTSIDEADYYNGEAWLAIAVYSDLHRDDARTAAELADLDGALIERYTRSPSRNFFHWGAMAAAQRYATTGDQRFLGFIRGQADRFVTRIEQSLGPETNHCATMEGVAAALAALNRAGEGRTERARSLRRWLAEEAARLPALQIQPGQTGMALGGSAQLVAPRMAEFPGSFLQGSYHPSTRVDNGQHCVSAMLMIDRGRLLLAPE
jgi:hypothetical protein